jgi:hypothetical protein
MSSGIKDELMRHLHHLDASEGLRHEALGPVTHISITDRQQGVSDENMICTTSSTPSATPNPFPRSARSRAFWVVHEPK